MKTLTILDGGVGSELQRRGFRLHNRCWSAPANLTHPELVLDIHLDYIEAGADLITTNTMMSGRIALELSGYDNFNFNNSEAARLALRARETSGKRDVLVAGSISTLPPLDRATSFSTGTKARDSYYQQANILVDSGCDLLLVEMLINSESAIEALEECCKFDIPIWAGCSAMRDNVSQEIRSFRQEGTLLEVDHEPLSTVLKIVSQHPIERLGIMHSELTVMDDALKELDKHWDGLKFAYSHIGCADKHDWVFSHDNNSDNYAEAAASWFLAHNVTAIGGCCGTTPQYIKALSKRLDSYV